MNQPVNARVIEETTDYVVFEQRGFRVIKRLDDAASDLTVMKIDDAEAIQTPEQLALLQPLVLIDAPTDVILIGLGGGQQAKFIHQYLPELRSIALEIDQTMVDLARRHFGLPPDDERLQVVVADAADFMRDHEGQCDLIVSDAYGEGNRIVYELHTEDFYRRCLGILRADGIMTVNIYRPSETWGVGYTQMLRRLFARVYVIKVSDVQFVLILCKSAPGPDWDAITARAVAMQSRSRLPVVDFVATFPRTTA
jgi:spermidine synthase